jgi:AcrR family transcriptional regulator
MRKRNKGRSIARIKQSTLQLFEKRGYAGTTMSAIAKEADVNIALVYRYFPRGKIDIILAVGADILEQVQTGFDVSPSQTPRDALRSLVRQMIDTHRKHKTLLKAMKVEFLSKKDVYEEEEFAILTGGVEAPLGFSKLITALGFKDVANPEEVGRRVFHLIDGLIHRHVLIVRIDEDDDRVAEFIADLVLSYLS